MRPLSADKSLAIVPFDEAAGIVNFNGPESQTQANIGLACIR